MRPKRFRSGDPYGGFSVRPEVHASMRPKRFRSGDTRSPTATAVGVNGFNEAEAFPLRRPESLSADAVHRDLASMRPKRFRSGDRKNVAVNDGGESQLQ